jgi:hypothetical protein
MGIRDRKKRRISDLKFQISKREEEAWNLKEAKIDYRHIRRKRLVVVLNQIQMWFNCGSVLMGFYSHAKKRFTEGQLASLGI